MFIVTIKETDLYNLVVLAKKYDIHTQTIGKVTDDAALNINNQISLKKEEMSYN